MKRYLGKTVSERELLMQRLKVPGMRCGHCADAVTRAIQGVHPEAKVTVDLEGKWVTVEGSGDSKRLTAAIEAAGFEVGA